MSKEKEIVPYQCSPRAPRSVLTECGSRWMIKHRYFKDEHGDEQCEPGDKVDWDAYIQSSKASCDIEQIIARYNAGDETVLNVNPNGFYGNVSMIPNSVNDVQKISQMSDIAYSNYEKLPSELKALYGSPAEFFNAVLSNKAESILADYLQKKQNEADVPASSKQNEADVPASSEVSQ